MSLVVLKNKTRHIKAPISGKGSDGFSLNGTLRNKGPVGPTNLARSVTRTPMRGNTPRGHGGCCGQYKIDILNSGGCCVNDNKIVKLSTKNTKGMLQKRYECNVQYPLWIVKTAGQSPNAYDQGDYIKNLHVKASGSCSFSEFDVSGNTCKSNTPGSNFIGSRRITNKCNISKGPAGTGKTISQNEYLTSLLYKKKCLPQDLYKNKEPCPKWINSKPCTTYERNPCSTVNNACAAKSS